MSKSEDRLAKAIGYLERGIQKHDPTFLWAAFLDIPTGTKEQRKWRNRLKDTIDGKMPEGKRTLLLGKILKALEGLAPVDTEVASVVPHPSTFALMQATVLVSGDFGSTAAALGYNCEAQSAYKMLPESRIVIVNKDNLKCKTELHEFFVKYMAKHPDWVNMSAEFGYKTHKQHRGFLFAWLVPKTLYEEAYKQKASVTAWGLKL